MAIFSLNNRTEAGNQREERGPDTMAKMSFIFKAFSFMNCSQEASLTGLRCSCVEGHDGKIKLSGIYVSVEGDSVNQGQHSYSQLPP